MNIIQRKWDSFDDANLYELLRPPYFIILNIIPPDQRQPSDDEMIVTKKLLAPVKQVLNMPTNTKNGSSSSEESLGRLKIRKVHRHRKKDYR